MIQATIFDCFGVLYTDGKSRIINACPPEKRQELDDLFGQADYGFISGEEFSRMAADILGVTEAELEAMTSGLYARNEPLVAAIRRYKQQYKIGLLSNVSENLYEQLFSSEDERELFDAVVLSSRVGITKPSRGAYELIAEQLGVEVNRCVMIDDIDYNVHGAEEAGMKGLLFRSNAELETALDALLEQPHA